MLHDCIVQPANKTAKCHMCCDDGLATTSSDLQSHNMLASIRFQHDFQFSQHFFKQNAGWFVSPAKKINPASISAQPMLAGPQKLATQPIQPAFFIFKCLLTLDSSMILNLASIFLNKMLAASVG